jgi:hypothetical protein
MSNSIVWRDVAVIEQVSQKITNRPCDHLLRTAFVVEENEALSSRVGFLSLISLSSQPNGCADLIQQPGLVGWRRLRPWSAHRLLLPSCLSVWSVGILVN